MFKGDKKNFGENNLAKMEQRKNLPHIKTPDEINDNLQKDKVAGGEKIYATYCGPCHQRNGKGAVGRFPPLAESSWVSGNTTRLIAVVLKGLQGNIEVNGTGYNGVMPQQNFLTDGETAEVLTYIRQNFGNKGSAVTTEEVKALRNKLK